MTYLVGAVVVLAALTVLNLVLTAGVITRLKEHATRLTGTPADLSRVEQPLPVVGTTVAAYTADDVDGATVPPADRLTLVAFLTPSCPPCKEQLPHFLRRAAGDRRDAVLAVVSGDGPEAERLAATVRPVARVVVEGHHGPVQQAFGASALPAFCLLDAEGRIAAAAPKVAELGARVPA